MNQFRGYDPDLLTTNIIYDVNIMYNLKKIKSIEVHDFMTIGQRPPLSCEYKISIGYMIKLLFTKIQRSQPASITSKDPMFV